MKKFIIEQKVNPTDNWKKYKQFDDKDKAFQSFNMLIKHVDNISKTGDYYKYRLHDMIDDKYWTIP